MKPTKANRTNITTASDYVMTPTPIAQLIISYFKPIGFCLEPAKGTGNFFNFLPDPKDWCEITEGKDFFNYNIHVDWIITNPPYSIYNKFLTHCFDIADNVVLLTPIAKAFKSMAIEKLVDEYGGLKEILLLGSGTKCGFAFGFPTGCLYYKRDYKGYIKRTTKLIIQKNYYTCNNTYNTSYPPENSGQVKRTEVITHKILSSQEIEDKLKLYSLDLDFTGTPLPNGLIMLHRKPKNLTREEAINIAIDTMKEAEEERRIVVEKEANVGISYD